MSEEVNFIPEDELLINSESELSCLILRFKNCTGNVIDFSTKSPEFKLTMEDKTRAQAALSVDYQFKNQRRRTIA